MRNCIKKTMLSIIVFSVLLYVTGCRMEERFEINKADVTSEDKVQLLNEKTVSIGMAEKASTTVEIESLGLPEDMLAYWLVLNSKKPFVSVNEGGQEFYWNEYHWQLDATCLNYRAQNFMSVDMDGDGGKEVVLYCLPETTQVLHYEGGKVYSYQTAFRGMKRICADGTFDGSSGASVNGYYRITEFNDTEFLEETLAYMNGDYYEVLGIEVSSEEFYKYAERIEEKEHTEIFDFTEELLNEQLLGELTEEEISILRNVPIEEMETTETEYLMNTDAMQAYYEVLVNENKFISIEDGNEEFSLNDYVAEKQKEIANCQILYFSVVDMNGDDEPEIVLSYYPEMVQILHYSDGETYSYLFDEWMEMREITRNGTYYSYDSEKSGYRRIADFNSTGCVTEEISIGSVADNRIRYYTYTQENVQAYFDNH